MVKLIRSGTWYAVRACVCVRFSCVFDVCECVCVCTRVCAPDGREERSLTSRCVRVCTGMRAKTAAHAWNLLRCLCVAGLARRRTGHTPVPS